MTTPLRALLLTPVIPDPKGSGLQQRAFRLLLRLAADANPHLVLAGGWSKPPVLSATIYALISGYSCMAVRQASPLLRRIALILPWVVFAEPSLATGWLSPAGGVTGDPLPAGISQLVVFRLRTHGMLRALPQKLIASAVRHLDMDDLESATLRSIAELAWQQRQFKLALSLFGQSKQYEALEVKYVGSYGLVSVANPADKARLAARFPGVPLSHLPNVVDAGSDASHLQPLESEPVFLFIGTLEYFPNEDAARWIAGEICEALRRDLGRPFRLWIAGRKAPRALMDCLIAVPEVNFLGEVYDLSPLYRRCHAVLAPVRAGGGTKLKVLEAMAHGCPVIATPHAVDGLPGIAGQHFLIANNARQFAAQCRILVEYPATWEAIAGSGLQMVTTAGMSAPPSIK